jgi:23S rRNA G2445 N2-methylase RlmL
MISKCFKFYVRCAPGHTEVSHIEINAILKKLRGCTACVEKERDQGRSDSKNGLYVKTDEFKHGIEIAMKSLTVQDIEYVILDEVCKTKRDVKRRLKKIAFEEFITPQSLSNIEDFKETFKLHSRANKSIVNSSRFLKEEFCNALVTSGVLTEQTQLGGIEGDTTCVQPLSNVPTPSPSNTIRLSLIENRLTVSVSLVGEMELYKRSYKNLAGVATAPLAEHHASACILWACHTIHHKVKQRQQEQVERHPCQLIENKLTINNIMVPFAGTGTLGFECLLALLEGAGSGLFNERTFAFDSFPCASSGGSAAASTTSAGSDSDRKIETISSEVRQQMRAEIASKLSDIHHDKPYDASMHLPRISRDTKILFSDINADALSACKDNIQSFLLSSGNTFPKSLFPPPKLADFLTDDISSMMLHSSHAVEDDIHASCDTSPYSSGTTFILLNPPFGLRLAKKSSTSSLYHQTATKLINIRDKISQLKKQKYSDGSRSGSGRESPAPATALPAVSLMGMCLCPDVKTWSTFITTLSAGGFGCETTHFSLGGNDMRAVCFWDELNLNQE